MRRTLQSFIFAFLVCNLTVSAQITGKQAVAQMLRGINIGNTFDAPSGETTWGNPAVQEYYFDDYKDAGFSAIRIPVTWTKHTLETSPYSIDKAFLDRVETVVDWGLNRGLYIIINAHHEGWLKNPNECIAGNQCGFTQANQDRFNSIWSQVAQRFKSKSYKLLFEILNEPEDMSLSNLNLLQARVIKIIRASGGNNAKRIVVFTGTKWSAGDELIKADIPENDRTYLIANYHQYSPWDFVSDQSKTKHWGSDADKNSVKSIFDLVKGWANTHDLAVMFNEWGAGFDTHEYNSVMEFYLYYVQCAANYNFAPFVWDDGGQFRTYERNERKWHGDLIDVLTNPMLSKNGMKAVGWNDARGVSRLVSDTGIHYVGNIDTGAWMSYKINVPSSGQYLIELQVACWSNTGVISIEAQGGKLIYALVNLPNTGGYYNWQTVKATITLNSGEQHLATAAKVGGFNVKVIKLTKITQNNDIEIVATNRISLENVES